jgi:photosystem II stability/assembly factor-like uncharacterized protein
MVPHRRTIATIGLVIALAATASSCDTAGARSDGGVAKSSEKAATPSVRTPTAPPAGSPAGVWLNSLQMVSATTGWALLSTSNPNDNSDLQLGRTTDGGRTWMLVTPPAPEAALVDGTVQLKVTSAERAWVATATPSPARGTTVVFRTVDGGRSWQRSASIAANQPVAMDIIGPRGWLLESLGAAMGSNPVRVYRTTDAGRHWSLAAKSGTGRAAARGLVAACDKVGMGFGSAKLGWITSECAAGYSVLVTRDGATSWVSQNLPVPQSGCQQAGCVLLPVMLTGTATVLEMEAYPDLALLLVSRDAGMNWRVLEMPAGAGPYPRVQFFGPADAIAVSAGSQGSVGSIFYVTSDGGLSWTAVPQGRHFGRGGASFDFVSPTTGFAWLLPGINAASPGPKVYLTSDSGRAWTSFVPRLG